MLDIVYEIVYDNNELRTQKNFISNVYNIVYRRLRKDKNGKFL